MLSVLIETRDHEEALARTLASLVPGAVQGVVREVIVCDLGSTDHTHVVAEHAGCQFLREGGIAAGIARTKSDWVLVLEPGARLVEGWMESVADHLTGSGASACFTPAGAGKGLRLPWFGARRPLADGILLTKRDALALIRPGGSAKVLARGRPKRLAGEIVPAPASPDRRSSLP